MAQSARQSEIPLGIVIRKAPGVTRWARWIWTTVAVLPGAAPADWVELRRAGDTVDFHAATLPLQIFAADTPAYMANLGDGVPSVYVVSRRAGDGRPQPALVTVSPYEGQDYSENGEDVVEKLAMTDGLIAWLHAFTRTHHQEEAFVKRRRDKAGYHPAQDGKGDHRIRQVSDVYRAPRRGGGGMA